jgi:glutamate-1-semialdehyde aminotransferase
MIPPSQFEAMFISASHTNKDITQTLVAFKQSFKILGLK